MKWKMLCLIAGLLFAVPGMAGANEMVPDTHKGTKEAQPCDCQEKGHHTKAWQEKVAERERLLLTWVEKYTPDKKQEWKQTLDEKKALRNEWLSSENAEKRERWKSERMAKMKELRQQLEEGKITKEEFIQKAHGGKDMGKWKSFHELKLAIEKNDDQQAAAILNQLLVQYKEHNAKFKEKLEQE